jgi:hypothetical protein
MKPVFIFGMQTEAGKPQRAAVGRSNNKIDKKDK